LGYVGISFILSLPLFLFDKGENTYAVGGERERGRPMKLNCLHTTYTLD